MHYHFGQLLQKPSGDLPSGWVEGGRQKGPCTFPRMLMGQNHNPGLTISSRVWGSGLVFKGHNSKGPCLILALPFVSCMTLGQ